MQHLATLETHREQGQTYVHKTLSELTNRASAKLFTKEARCPQRRNQKLSLVVQKDRLDYVLAQQNSPAGSLSYYSAKGPGLNPQWQHSGATTKASTI